MCPKEQNIWKKYLEMSAIHGYVQSMTKKTSKTKLSLLIDFPLVDFLIYLDENIEIFDTASNYFILIADFKTKMTMVTGSTNTKYRKKQTLVMYQLNINIFYGKHYSIWNKLTNWNTNHMKTFVFWIRYFFKGILAIFFCCLVMQKTSQFYV